MLWQRGGPIASVSTLALLFACCPLVLIRIS